MKHRHLIGAALALCLAACGTGEQESASTANEAMAVNQSAAAETAKSALPACPFTETREWVGSVENGRVLVTGYVDLQMAGFKPGLTPRSTAGGTLALDLALTPEPNAVVSDLARYEAGGGSYRQGEIWCGGERIAQFNMVVVN